MRVKFTGNKGHKGMTGTVIFEGKAHGVGDEFDAPHEMVDGEPMPVNASLRVLYRAGKLEAVDGPSTSRRGRKPKALKDAEARIAELEADKAAADERAEALELRIAELEAAELDREGPPGDGD